MNLVPEICPILGFYAAHNGSFLPSWRVKRSKPELFTLENGTYRLSRNVSTELPFYAA